MSINYANECTVYNFLYFLYIIFVSSCLLQDSQIHTRIDDAFSSVLQYMSVTSRQCRVSLLMRPKKPNFIQLPLVNCIVHVAINVHIYLTCFQYYFWADKKIAGCHMRNWRW